MQTQVMLKVLIANKKIFLSKWLFGGSFICYFSYLNWVQDSQKLFLIFSDMQEFTHQKKQCKSHETN